jgi:hypothetical protein
MDVVGNSTQSMTKRVREEMDREKKEVDQPTRIKTTWEYLEELKKLQSLEIEIEQVQKRLRMKENRFPDLKGLRGAVDHISEDRFWEVEVDDKRRIVAGKSFEEATEKYKKKLDQDKKNAEKQKANSKKKEDK